MCKCMRCMHLLPPPLQLVWNPDNWKRSYILNGSQDWSQSWTVKTDSGVCASKRGRSISLFTLRSQIFCLKPCLLCIPVSPCPPSFLLPQTADTHTINIFLSCKFETQCLLSPTTGVNSCHTTVCWHQIQSVYQHQHIKYWTEVFEYRRSRNFHR